MKKISKEVKATGPDGKKVVIDVVEVPHYESIKEMVAALNEDKVLALANRQYSSDITNEARAAKTRIASPTAKLTRMAKQSPELQKEIEKLIAKYQPAGGAAA